MIVQPVATVDWGTNTAGRTALLDDFYHAVDHAVRHGYTNKFIRRWNGDRSITLATQPEVFVVEDPQGLDRIARQALTTNREIAFGGIIDETHRRIIKFTLGSEGTRIACDWGAGDLIERVKDEASTQGHKYFLGHTHPENYGALSSREYWNRAQLMKFTDPVSQAMLRSGGYWYFGTDMLEMRVRQWLDPQLSSFFWILSPKYRQAGLLRIAPGIPGRIEPNEDFDPVNTYVPWTVKGPSPIERALEPNGFL